jgi:hypothetical protein
VTSGSEVGVGLLLWQLMKPKASVMMLNVNNRFIGSPRIV